MPRPGVTIKISNMPPPIYKPYDDICWEEFYKPPTSELVNTACYHKQWQLLGHKPGGQLLNQQVLAADDVSPFTWSSDAWGICVRFYRDICA